jgi:hypothetical protein
MTYSLDFSKHVLRINASDGLSFAETSKRFKIGRNSLFLWSNQIVPKRKRNKLASKIDMGALKADVIAYPDAYPYEPWFGLTQAGIKGALKRLKVSYKKNIDLSCLASTRFIT